MHRVRIRNRFAIGGATLLVLALAAEGRADSHRHRVVMIQPVRVYAPPPGYWPRYFGPVSGTWGSPSYGIAARRSSYYYGTPLPPAHYDGLPAPGYSDAPWLRGSPDPARELDPETNPVLKGTLRENEMRWGPTMPPIVSTVRSRTRFRPSSPERQMKSIHAQQQGDVWMRKLKFLNAYERYSTAIKAASDRPEPYFRIGYALAAIASFDSAVKYIKQGLDLDPHWPAHGERLDAIFGDDNRLTVLTMIQRVGAWTREDIRDPDRLFLMGVILHFDGDSRASQFFEAAYRLAGYGDHLLAFLEPSNPAAAPGRQPPTGGGFVAPPLPEEPQGFFGQAPIPQQLPQDGGNAPPFAAPGPTNSIPMNPSPTIPGEKNPGVNPPAGVDPFSSPPAFVPDPMPPRSFFAPPHSNSPPTQTAPSYRTSPNPAPNEKPMPWQRTAPPAAVPPASPDKNAPKPPAADTPKAPLVIPPLPAPEENPDDGPVSKASPMQGPLLIPPADSSTAQTR